MSSKVTKNKSSNVKKISFQKIESLIKNQSKYKSPINIEVPINETEVVELQVKPLLNIHEMAAFIHSVVDGCFTEIEIGDGKTEVLYTPYYKTLWIHRNLLEYFVANYKSDSNLDRLYSLITKTDIIDRVLEVIDEDQICEVFDAVDKMIEFRKQELLSRRESKFDELLSNMNDFVLKISEKVDELDLASLMQYIPSISKAINSDKFDMSKLVKAIIEIEKSDNEKELGNVSRLSEQNKRDMM